MAVTVESYVGNLAADSAVKVDGKVFVSMDVIADILVSSNDALLIALVMGQNVSSAATLLDLFSQTFEEIGGRTWSPATVDTTSKV